MENKGYQKQQQGEYTGPTFETVTGLFARKNGNGHDILVTADILARLKQVKEGDIVAVFTPDEQKEGMPGAYLKHKSRS